MALIDVGTSPYNMANTFNSGTTVIIKNNPANDSGTLTDVKIWANSNLSGVKVGLFYNAGGSNYTCRSAVTIGSVSAGSTQTFTGLSLAVQTNDIIGMYWSGGLMEGILSGGAGYWVKTGDFVSVGGTQTYTSVSGRDIDLYAELPLGPPTVSSVRLTSSFAGWRAVGNITNKGGATVTKRGVAYNLTGGDPDATVDSVVEETGDFDLGEFTAQLSGLAPGATYYVRPYCYNSGGFYGYGTTMTVTVQSPGASQLKATTYGRLRGQAPPSTTFEAIRAGGGTLYEPEDTNPDNLGTTRTTQTVSPWLFRTFLDFDLTGVSQDWDEVRLHIYVYEVGDYCNLRIAEGVMDEAGPTLANWLSQNGITNLLYSEDGIDGAYTGWLTLTLNSTGQAFVRTNAGGRLKLCIMTDEDYDNNYVLSVHDNYIAFYLSQEAGKEPYLEFVNYESGGAILLEQAYSVAGVRQSILAAAPVWTDITEYLMKIGRVKRGRQHEFDKVEAGTMVVTLNNAAGHFWRYNTAGDYYPDIQPLTLTRLRWLYKGTYYNLWYGVSEAYRPGWVVDGEGGFSPIIQMECVDLFKSFNRYKLADNTSKLTEAESAGSSHVVLEDVSNLHVGQSLKIVEGSQSEVKIIQVVSEAIKTVIFTTVLDHAYSTNAHVKKFPAVLSGQRIRDCVLELGWPAALTDIDDGQCYVTEHTPPAEGTNIMDHIYKVAESEDGVPFMRGDGYFVFQDSIARTVSPLNTSQATFVDDAVNNPYVHIELVDDDTFIFNEADIHGSGIQQQQVIVADKQAEQGPRAIIRKESQLLLNSDAFVQAFSLASRFQGSILRAEALVIKPQADPENLLPKVLGYELSTRITVQLNSATNPAVLDKEYHIEGLEFSWDPASELTFKWQLWSVNRYRAYSCQHDGYFRNYSNGGTYEDMHDAAAADYVENDGSEHNPYTDPNEIVVGQDLFNSFLGFNGSLWRGFLEFDTTGLLTAETPVSAVLILHIKESHIDDNLWNLVVVDPDTLVNPLVDTDYHVLLSQTTQQGAATMLRAGYWLMVPLNATGLGLIVKEGVTRLALRSNRDISSLHGATSVEKAIFDNINTAYPPRLLIQLAE